MRLMPRPSSRSGTVSGPAFTASAERARSGANNRVGSGAGVLTVRTGGGLYSGSRWNTPPFTVTTTGAHPASGR
jgi:hypothetical protein